MYAPQNSSVRNRVKHAITEFNLTINNGYDPKEDYVGLIMNFLKKSLVGYMKWGEIGRIKRKGIYVKVEDKRLVSLYLSPTYFAGDSRELSVKIDAINQAIRDLDLESLYNPNMLLGKFSQTTERLIESIKSFKF